MIGRDQLSLDRTAGDDRAVLTDPSGQAHLLLAIEGLASDFVQAMPWLAGYSAVMVNLSDTAAMGGHAVAVVDALWSADEAMAVEIVAGMQTAAERYGVPLVGGHTNLRAAQGQLAVAVLGRAERLISSFAAQRGDRLLMATDLRSRWMDPYPFWNASTEAPPERLRADMALLAGLAQAGLVDAGKDISMAGVLGTTLMLLECSRVGACIDLARIPAPPGAGSGDAQLRWLTAFPSFGFVLAVRPAAVAETTGRFAARGIACADIGEVTAGSTLRVSQDGQEALLWDLSTEAFITATVRGGQA